MPGSFPSPTAPSTGSGPWGKEDKGQEESGTGERERERQREDSDSSGAKEAVLVISNKPPTQTTYAAD